MMKHDDLKLEGNKYFKWYWSICNRAKDRVLSPDIYVEKHHIYPKSIYGQNQDLVKLTAKEHYIVHLLLWYGLKEKYGTKDVNTIKMAGAFASMNMKKNGTYQRYNSKLFMILKIAYSEFNKNRKFSDESKLKMSIAKKNMSDETRLKMSIAQKGKPAWNKGLKNCQTAWNKGLKNCQTAWNKGLKKENDDRVKKYCESKTGFKHSDESKEKNRISHLGKIPNEESKEKNRIANSGKNNAMYGKKVFDIWVEKYGIDEANRKQSERNEKHKQTILNKRIKENQNQK